MKTMKVSPFIKKMVMYFIGSLSSKIMNFILVPIYAYYVAASDLGQYDYVVTLANVIMPIVYLAIWESILKFCLQETTEDKKNITSTALMLFFVMSCICFAICGFSYVVNNKDTNYITLLIIVVISGATSIWQFSARALRENRQYVIAGVGGSVVLLVLDLTFLLFSTLDYKALCITYAISQMIVILLLEMKVKLVLNFSIRSLDKKTFISMIAFSAPLVINNISLWLYSGGSRIIIRNYLGTFENGLYSFASKFSILISLVSSVVSMAVIEEAYSYKTLEEYKTKISKLVFTISKSYFSVTLLALPAIKILYKMAFSKTEYYSSSSFAFWLLLTALFTALSNNYGSAFQVTNKTKYIFITTLIGSIVSLVISIILVHQIGVTGVLIGGAIGPFIMMLARALYANRVTGLKVKWTENIVLFCIALVTNIVLSVQENIFALFGIFFICVVVVLIFYRKEINIYIIKKKRR